MVLVSSVSKYEYLMLVYKMGHCYCMPTHPLIHTWHMHKKIEHCYAPSSVVVMGRVQTDL